MIIHIVKKYIAYSNMGLVDHIVCADDSDHGPVQCGMTVDDRVYLYCVYCNYKVYPGLNTLSHMAKDVYRIDVEKQLRRVIV